MQRETLKGEVYMESNKMDGITTGSEIYSAKTSSKRIKEKKTKMAYLF